MSEHKPTTFRTPDGQVWHRGSKCSLHKGVWWWDVGAPVIPDEAKDQLPIFTPDEWCALRTLLTKEEQMVGKTVASVTNEWTDHRLVINFSDGTIIAFDVHDDEMRPVTDADLNDWERVRLGLMSQMKAQEKADALRDAEEKLQADCRRRQWEILNKEFGE